MFILGFITAAYVLITLLALIMTYNEQQQTGNRSLQMKMLACLGCLFWPFTLLAVAAQRSAT